MALDGTYAGLVSSIAGWLNRQDLADNIPDFIALFEADFNTDPRGRTQRATITADATVETQYSPVPTDYLEMQSLYIPGQRNPKLEYLTQEQMNSPEYYNSWSDSQTPKYFAVVGQQIKFLPVPKAGTLMEMTYYAQLPALSDDMPSNWLLANHPGIYLYGSLMHSAPFLKSDDRVQTWVSLHTDLMEKLHLATDRARYSGATLKTRTKGF